MPSKKQRRRRAKELRHDYEYVYIDEEGKEVEVEQPPSPRRDKERRPAASTNGRRPAQMRPVQPPSWKYLRKQAIIFFVIIFVAFSILNRSLPVAALTVPARATTPPDANREGPRSRRKACPRCRLFLSAWARRRAANSTRPASWES